MPVTGRPQNGAHDGGDKSVPAMAAVDGTRNAHTPPAPSAPRWRPTAAASPTDTITGGAQVNGLHRRAVAARWTWQRASASAGRRHPHLRSPPIRLKPATGQRPHRSSTCKTATSTPAAASAVNACCGAASPRLQPLPSPLAVSIPFPGVHLLSASTQSRWWSVPSPHLASPPPFCPSNAYGVSWFRQLLHR